MAQLVERSLPRPEIRASNPVIGNVFTVNCIEKMKINEIKEKEAGTGPFLETIR